MNLSADHGMSGGPVYTFADDRYIAIGIISHENSTGTANYACRITERLQTLITWAEEIGYANIDPSLDVEDSPGEGSGGGSGSASPDTGGSIADMYKHHLEE